MLSAKCKVCGAEAKVLIHFKETLACSECYKEHLRSTIDPRTPEIMDALSKIEEQYKATV